MSTSEATAAPHTEATTTAPSAPSAGTSDHFKASLDKLRHNVSTYVLFCFLLAWCLTGGWTIRASCSQLLKSIFLYTCVTAHLICSRVCPGQQQPTSALLCAGTSANLLFNLPIAAVSVGLLYWLLQQQEAKIKQSLGCRSEQRRGASGEPSSYSPRGSLFLAANARMLVQPYRACPLQCSRCRPPLAHSLCCLPHETQQRNDEVWCALAVPAPAVSPPMSAKRSGGGSKARDKWKERVNSSVVVDAWEVLCGSIMQEV